MTKPLHDLRYFFNPQSIAIIGASANFDSISGKPLRYLKEHGYKGKVYPVNPKYEELGGFKCYKSVLEIPDEVDLVLVAVNYKLVLPMLEQCVEKGVKFATIFSSGFAESGEEGKILQEKIAQLAEETGIGVVGPNCQGSINVKECVIGGFSSSVQVKPLRFGPIGYVTQSGALGYAIFNLAQESGVGFSCVASTGNEVYLHTLDFMEYLLEDADTSMVISYLEGIKDGRQFARVAERALELNKPIVTLKAGRTEVGQKAASSHTASLTGSDAVADAFFRQKGIIRVNDIENMIDIAALMQRIPNLPKGKKLGIITTSGGGGIVAADEAVDMNLDIPELDPKTKEIIMAVIPDYGSALNPVDVTAHVLNTAEDFMTVLEAMEVNPDIDALVIVVTMITGEPGKNMAEDIVKMSKKTKKPLTVAWTAGDQVMGDNQRVLVEGGVQMYRSPVRAVRAMGSLMNYSVFRDGYMARDRAAGADAVDGKVRASALEVLAKAEQSLTESQGKELFGLYGIPCTKEEVATSEEHAVEIAGKIGYPLVLKIDSPDILHKTEAGGLKLGIKNRKELVAAYNEVLENAAAYDPKARINGVLVQEMVSGGTEVIVGVKNDPQFGPTIMFGLGGIFVEILKDVSLRVTPVTREDAMAMIQEIKGFKVLAGARGKAKADVEAIADVLVKVSRMALDLEEHVAELDINPLLALPEGKGVRVADALVIKR
ncbi:MAG: acetate--CoA ligase family protein [bacterium]|nr:MAG: acetate--CoA ligase family protein [bacterium]